MILAVAEARRDSSVSSSSQTPQAEFEKIDWENFGRKVRDAGEDGVGWAQQVAEEVKTKLARFEVRDVNDLIARTATTLADALDNLDGTGLGGWIRKASDALESNETLDNLQAVKLEDLPQEVLQYIKDNPKNTAFYVVQGLVFIHPGLVSTPFFHLLGFSGRGPAAKTVATALQSKLRTVSAGSPFSMAQGAAMGRQGSTGR